MRDARLITRVDRLAEGDVTVVLEPLKFIKIIDRYEHRCRLPVLRQHNTFMAAPGTVDQFGEMTAGLRNRTRERHSSTVQLGADSCRYGAPTAAARRRGPLRGRLPAESVHRLQASQELPDGHDGGGPAAAIRSRALEMTLIGHLWDWAAVLSGCRS